MSVTRCGSIAHTCGVASFPTLANRAQVLFAGFLFFRCSFKVLFQSLFKLFKMDSSVTRDFSMDDARAELGLPTLPPIAQAYQTVTSPGPQATGPDPAEAREFFMIMQRTMMTELERFFENRQTHKETGAPQGSLPRAPPPPQHPNSGAEPQSSAVPGAAEPATATTVTAAPSGRKVFLSFPSLSHAILLFSMLFFLQLVNVLFFHVMSCTT
jgi:hypothetical protein